MASSIARVETLRRGAQGVTVSWSWKGVSSPSSSALITDLYLQVVPAKGTESLRRAVVDKLFSRWVRSEASEDLPTSAGNGQMIHFQVSEAEQGERKKRITLVPNCTYEISIGVITSERYVQRSNVSRVRLGFVVLCVAGSGDLSKSSRKSRRLDLGRSSLLCRATTTVEPPSTRLSGATRDPRGEASWHDEEGVKLAASSSSAGDHELSNSWNQAQGLSITALRMGDLEPVYHKCFSTYDYRDDFVSSSAVAQLYTELSEVGRIREIMSSKEEKHLWVIASCGGWEVSSKSKQLGSLLSNFVLDLGASEEEAKNLSEASLRKGSASGRGCRPFAFVGASPVSSTRAFLLPEWAKNGYTDAEIQVCLSFDEDNWFPAFKRTGGHWQVWTGVPEEARSDKTFERVRTSNDLKLRRNHVVINELEEICKHFAHLSDDRSFVPFDLTQFLHIIFDMIKGYDYGKDPAGPKGSDAIEGESPSLGIHDPECPSPRAFMGAVACLSVELESVLTKLLQNFPQLACQLVEAGAVEFLVARISMHCGFSKSGTANSLRLLVALASEKIEEAFSPRKHSGDGCPMLLEYSKNAQPRLLAEIHRRGGVLAASVNFERYWVEAAHSENPLPDYGLMQRLAVFMLQVAEMRTSVVSISFSRENRFGERQSFAVNAIQSRLPISPKCKVVHPKGKVVVADVTFMQNQFEPEKVQAWGPGWASSGELLGFSDPCLCLFKDSVVVIPAARDWNTHCAIVLQACRLVWIAGCAGAVGVVFVWPGPLVQQMYPNLNFSHLTEIPAYIVPSSSEISGVVEGIPGDGAVAEMSLLYSADDRKQALEYEVLAQEEGLSSTATQLWEEFSICLKRILCCAPECYEDKKRPIRVLTLDGGGAKGISTICMLKEISKAIEDEEVEGNRSKDRQKRSLAQHFDLVVGTSAGGIIAMALGSGMALDEMEDFFNKSVREIFASRDTYWDQLQRGPGASAARRLEELIKEEWPKRTPFPCSADSPSVSIPYHRPQKNSGDLPGICMLTTLVSREPSRCCMLKSYISNGDHSIPYLPAVHRATILQCIRATSAAPYYLEEQLCHKDVCTGKFYSSDDTSSVDLGSVPKLKTESFLDSVHLEPVISTYRFVDGAISVNNPTCAAILEARALYPDHPLVIVSLGTGNGLARVPIKTYPAGVGVVLQNLITSVSDVSLADSFAEHMVGKEDAYFRFCPTGDCFNADLGTKDPEVLSLMQAEAKAYMKRPGVRAKLQELLCLL
ncbi:Patatin-like phospholipase [Chloropicon primus]|uniref:Patatin n=4 Tax=Chloropicon primus TaxID=1764295 RepID=A0A5B8MJ12_9CHLO|nr:Patatin-like phospholipase [Chloropicon primus]|eukprot:QDZ19380.1 Patatin-like phospholipase [Chloropicon primus]